MLLQAYIPKKLEEVVNYERDHARLTSGKDTGVQLPAPSRAACIGAFPSCVFVVVSAALRLH